MVDLNFGCTLGAKFLASGLRSIQDDWLTIEA